MNTKLSKAAAEISFLRDSLRQTNTEMTISDRDDIHRALILSQLKIMSIDITQSSRILDSGVSVAYH
ncbi:MAG: hypothetical protein L3J22_04475 [Xanthomonadales bacterium]|nr:hypothetical protein [Xanthomonadales bacterium]